jgi:hypothetical protein
MVMLKVMEVANEAQKLQERILRSDMPGLISTHAMKLLSLMVIKHRPKKINFTNAPG